MIIGHKSSHVNFWINNYSVWWKDCLSNQRNIWTFHPKDMIFESHKSWWLKFTSNLQKKKEIHDMANLSNDSNLLFSLKI